jgi:hypothetical protein
MPYRATKNPKNSSDSSENCRSINSRLEKPFSENHIARDATRPAGISNARIPSSNQIQMPKYQSWGFQL